MAVQWRTLLNSITDDLMRVFWNSCTKNFGKLSAKNIQGSYLLLELHNIVYSLLPDCTTDTFLERLENKGCSKISKIPRKIFAKVCLFL